jgi:hypothetical protein
MVIPLIVIERFRAGSFNYPTEPQWFSKAQHGLVGDLVAPHVSGNWNNSLNAGVSLVKLNNHPTNRNRTISGQQLCV